MHEIEPYYAWRSQYTAEDDEQSPFFGKSYDEFQYENRIYNYYIHPQWDDFGSETLYVKILYTDYDEGFTILELIGEWNDCLHNDIMFLKRNVLDPLMKQGVFKFLVIGENVLNFHGGDDDYYEEWHENAADHDGWILFMNLHQHVFDEMYKFRINYYVQLFPFLMNYEWRKQEPQQLYNLFESLMNKNKFIETE